MGWEKGEFILSAVFKVSGCDDETLPATTRHIRWWKWLGLLTSIFECIKLDGKLFISTA